MDSRGSVASIAFVVIIRKAYGYPVKTDYPNLAFKLIFPFCQNEGAFAPRHGKD
jgi:hypothetical protein